MVTPVEIINRECNIIMKLNTHNHQAINAQVVQNSALPKMLWRYTSQEFTDLKYKLHLFLGKSGSQDFVLESLVERKMQRALNGDWHCMECGLVNKMRQRIAQHIESKHMEVGSVCDICFKSCATRNALRVHKYRHHRPVKPDTVWSDVFCDVLSALNSRPAGLLCI